MDTVPPVIAVTSPIANFITNATSATLSGTVVDTSTFTLRIDGEVVPVTGGSFGAPVILGAEGTQTFHLEATDIAGNVGTLDHPIVIDRTPPVLGIASPPEDTVVTALPLAVSGTVNDSSSVSVTLDGTPVPVTGTAWQGTIPSLSEGPVTLLAIATDQAGNSSSAIRNILVDLSPPVLIITAPESGSLTNQATTTLTGSVTDISTVTATVNGAPITLSGTGPYTFAHPYTLTPDDNTLLVIATDGSGRTSEEQVIVTYDGEPPVVTVEGPERIRGSTPETVTAIVTDNLAVAEVEFLINGVSSGTYSSGPYQIQLTVPEGVESGDTISVSVTGTDTAGNKATATLSVIVSAEGVLVGQVLSDLTGLPLEGADVTAGDKSTVTDDAGATRSPRETSAAW